MKEVKVAKLGKDDVRTLKEIEELRHEMESRVVELQAQQRAWWDSLRDKHNLAFGKTHYIRNNVIYIQEV